MKLVEVKWFDIFIVKFYNIINGVVKFFNKRNDSVFFVFIGFDKSESFVGFKSGSEVF